MKKNLICTLLLLSLLIRSSFAQTDQTAIPQDNGSWFMYFGDNSIGGKWRLFTDIQARNLINNETQNQLLLRTGITYRFSREFSLTGGMAYINTVTNNVMTREHRIWQQAVFAQWFASDKIMIEHRYRFEQRFIKKYSDPVVDRYANRARYRLQTRFSLGLVDQSLNKLFLNAYDEVFLNIGGNISNEIFDRNRAYIALGYFLSPQINLQVGYLNQFINIPNKFTLGTNHNLQVGLFMNADFVKKKE
jgi:hypothetical protein